MFPCYTFSKRRCVSLSLCFFSMTCRTINELSKHDLVFQNPDSSSPQLTMCYFLFFMCCSILSRYDTNIKQISNFKLIFQNYNQLSKIYSNPSDVDLIVGGIMEEPATNSLFGPTFSWLLTNQLIRTRQADRYFYTNLKQPKPFTAAQIDEIKKVTLARIMCDNSNIKKIQRNVFHKVTER